MLKHIHKTAQKNRKKYYIILTALFLSLLFFYFILIRPALALVEDAQELKDQAGYMKMAWQQKDYERIKNQELRIKDSAEEARSDFEQLGYLKYVPWVRGYYNDGEHFFNAAEYAFVAVDEVIDAIEPFKEVLGFNVQTVREVTAEEKLAQLVQVAPSLVPALEKSAQQINLIRAELNQVNPNHYPREIQGLQVRPLLSQARDQLNSAQTLLDQAGPVIRSLPAALGEPTPQNYLILFQNDKELRPTGGFITAFALVKFDRGTFEVIRSDNIYSIDPKNATLAAPQPILDYLYVPSWHMRDTNFSPDFARSMQDFEAYLEHTDLPPINGIIALDTHFLEVLMTVTGAVEVPEYSLDFSGYPGLPESCRQGGTTFTAENVVCRLELYTQRILLGREDRKEILGILMDKLVRRMLDSGSEEWINYMNVVKSEAAQKHVLFYLHEPTLQKLAESYNWAGRIEDPEANVDYLHISDANLAGLKADMYLIREVLQNIEIADDGTITKTLTLIYNNPEPQDGWLNAVARNYVRVYVPQGSKLMEFSGDVTRPAKTWDELGKTVFDNFILIPPLEVRSVTIKYQLPFKLTGDEYALLIQKQPGKDTINHEIVINGEKHTEKVYKDTRLQYHFE